MSDRQTASEFEVLQVVIKELSEIRAEIAEQREALMRAFPNEDVDGHCRYHELLIEGEQQRIKLRQAVIEKTLSGLVWMALIFVGTAIWRYFLSAVGKG